MSQQYEHRVLRARSDNGQFDQIMDDPKVKAYIDQLGLDGWRLASTTVNPYSEGFVMMVWFERERPASSTPAGQEQSVPESVEVMIPGYL